jgi:hypothetical protein
VTQVRPYTRTDPRTGRKVSIGASTRNSEGRTEAEQAKRDRFEQRVLRERHATQRAADFGTKPASVPGERKRKAKGPKPAGAKRRARKAVKLYRKHKIRAAGHALGALGELAGWAAAAGVRKARRRS